MLESGAPSCTQVSGEDGSGQFTEPDLVARADIIQLVLILLPYIYMVLKPTIRWVNSQSTKRAFSHFLSVTGHYFTSDRV